MREEARAVGVLVAVCVAVVGVFLFGAGVRAQRAVHRDASPQEQLPQEQASQEQPFPVAPADELNGLQISSREWKQGLNRKAEQPTVMNFTATAYTLEGRTAAGTIAREGIVAADPDVLPLGTRIRVSGAGKHSGEYVVEDTGPKIQGRKIDIKMDSDVEAKQFGERTVQVEVLRYGNGLK